MTNKNVCLIKEANLTTVKRPKPISGEKNNYIVNTSLKVLIAVKHHYTVC
jgi:hypothetical protein